MTSHEPRWHKHTGTGIHDPAVHASVSSECNQVVASYKDFGEHRVTFPRRDRHRSKEGYMPVNPMCSGAVANYQGSVEALGGISLYGRLPKAHD